MEILVYSQRRPATIKCFAASGNRFPPRPVQRKRAAALPQPSLGRSVVDMCRPVCLVRAASPPKLTVQAFGACHEIVKRENAVCGKTFLFFPARFDTRQGMQARPCRRIAAFSLNSRGVRNECRPGLLCRRTVSAVSMHCPAGADTDPPPPNRLQFGAAGSVLSGRQCLRPFSASGGQRLGHPCQAANTSVSPARFPPRSGSGRNGSWRPASA